MGRDSYICDMTPSYGTNSLKNLIFNEMKMETRNSVYEK